MSLPLDPQTLEDPLVDPPVEPIPTPPVEEPTSVEPDSAVSDPVLPPTEPAQVSPFADIPELKNASMEEIANLYQLQRNTMVSQRRELDKQYEEAQLPAEPTPVPADEYYADPEGSTRKIIGEELAKTTAPIMREMEVARAERFYDAMRGKYPDFAELEGFIREAATGGEVTEQNLYTAYLTVRGAKGLGIVPELDAMTHVAPAAPVVTPPHQPPTGPPPAEPVVTKRPLSEEERLYARKAGMTEDQYRDIGDEEFFEVGQVEQGGE